jgi:hypothetical protein
MLFKIQADVVQYLLLVNEVYVFQSFTTHNVQFGNYVIRDTCPCG